jgi:hypothetical protein
MPSSCTPTPGSTKPFLGCCPVVPAAKNLVQFVASGAFWGYQPLIPQGNCHPTLYSRFRAEQTHRNGTSGTYIETTNPRGGGVEVVENTIQHPGWADPFYSVFVTSSSLTSATFESKLGGVTQITTTITVDQPYGDMEADFQALIDALEQYYDEPIPTGTGFTMIASLYDLTGTLIHGEDAVLDGSFGLPDRFAICNADAWLFRQQTAFEYDTFTPVNSSTGFLIGPSFSLYSLNWCRAKIRITAPWYSRNFNTPTLLAPDGCTVVRDEYCEGGPSSCTEQTVPGTDLSPVIFTPSGNYNEYAQFAGFTPCP